MFIQVEETPNPATMKFLPGEQVLGTKTAFYTSADSAKESPLAGKLFSFEEVRAVFFGSDFITITKEPDADWQLIKPQITNAIMDHYVSGLPIVEEVKKNEVTEDDSELVKQIKELLETRVRPAVAMDGGDIIFHSFEDGIVKLEMHGACSGCPSSTITLKNGIENMLKHYVPEVEEVEAVN